MQLSATIHQQQTDLWTVHKVDLPENKRWTEKNNFKLALFQLLIERKENVVIDELVFQGDEPSDYFGFPTKVIEHLPFRYYNGYFAPGMSSYWLSCSWSDLDTDYLREAMNSGALFTFAGNAKDLLVATQSIPELAYPGNEKFWPLTIPSSSSITSLTFFGHDGESVISYTRSPMHPLPWRELLIQSHLEAQEDEKPTIFPE